MHGRSLPGFHQLIAVTIIVLSHIIVCKSDVSTKKASTTKSVEDISRLVAAPAGSHAQIATSLLSTHQSPNSKEFMNSSTREPTTERNKSTTHYQEELEFDGNVCTYFPTPNIDYKDKCCQHVYKTYVNDWNNGGRYLVVMLERLNRWRCKEFEDECKRPTWSFSEYTQRMYDLFCNRSKVETACYADIAHVARRYQFVNESLFPGAMTWMVLIEKLNSSAMELEDLVKSCVQAALFDRSDGGVGRFHEIIEPYAPFCGLQWQGYDLQTAQYRGVSPWMGMPSWCRHSIIACIAFMVAACITTILGNVFILIVFGTTAKLRNTQGVYRISLAFADLMIGFVMWPNMIILQYLTFLKPRHMGAVIMRPYIRTANMTPYDNADLVYRYSGGERGEIYDNHFVIAMGFFSLPGVILSIFILMFASVDRFWAVYRPLAYNPYVAKRRAVRLNVLLWFVCIVLCLLPIFIPGFSYKVASSNLIFAEGDAAFIVSGTLLIPLVTMWILNGMTYYMCRKHAIARRSIITCPSISRRDFDYRLASTLSMMVMAFSVSLVPVICTTVVSFTPAVTHWQRPWMLSRSRAAAYTTSQYMAIIMLASNSLWNFFIYNWRVKEFRKAALRMFRERFTPCILRRGVANPSNNTHGGYRKIAINVVCSNNSTSRQLPSSEPHSDYLEMAESHVDGPCTSGRIISENSVHEIACNDDVHSKYDRRRLPKSCDTRLYQLPRPTAPSVPETRGRRSTVLGSFVISANTADLYQSVMSNLAEYMETSRHAEGST